MTVTPPFLFGSALVIGLAVVLSFWISPVIAIPLLILGLAAVAFLGMGRAKSDAGKVKEMREQAQSGVPDDHFTERDRETLIEP